jgi:hypothetical protein
MAGVADYIQQEEFDRYTGYWPAPAVEVGADAIGMSGLLVKSTLIMRDNLEELNPNPRM